MKVLKLLTLNHITTSRAEAADFSDWLIKDLWSKYQLVSSNHRAKIMDIINSVKITIPNGTKGKPYESEVISLPSDIAYDYQFGGLSDLGLEAIKLGDTDDYKIVGIPSQSGDFSFVIRYKYDGWVEGKPLLERRIPFAVNSDPREIMEKSQKETPTDIPYYKADRVSQHLKVVGNTSCDDRKDIVAASVRGRSHGRDGYPRDDHFQIFHSDENDWYIIAVADGAGSAKFSRKGSEKACSIAIEYCKSKLEEPQDFEDAIRAYHNADDEAMARKRVGDMAYGILCYAAFKAHKAIDAVAKQNGDATPKDFATTLLLTVCKKFDFGWFVCSFWVGDGAISLYDKDNHTVKILGTPDEGEYSGQTRFLTMPEIFSDHTALFKRIRFCIVDDFTALMLMTDGVSDPMFGTDSNLNSVDRWDDFWLKLLAGFPDDGIPGIEFDRNNDKIDLQLQSWLDFWVRGEHDDRTLAILY